jgi:hypothetical protein
MPVHRNQGFPWPQLVQVGGGAKRDLLYLTSCAFVCFLATQGAGFSKPVAISTSWCVVATGTMSEAASGGSVVSRGFN